MNCRICLLFLLCTVYLSTINGQSHSSKKWEQVISITPLSKDKDITSDIATRRPIVYSDPQMMKIFESLKVTPAVIAFKICINQQGDISYIEIDEYKTSITERDILRNSMEKLRNYRFKASPKGKKEECGQFEIVIK